MKPERIQFLKSDRYQLIFQIVEVIKVIFKALGFCDPEPQESGPENPGADDA